MPSTTGLTVFIVDDNDMIRSLLRLIIQGEDYTVVGEAGTALAVKERVLTLRPDIICLDLVMPDCNNLELLTWLVTKLPDCIILVISGQNDRATVQNVLKNGAKGFIVKPFNPGAVLNTMQQATQHHPRAKKNRSSNGA